MKVMEELIRFHDHPVFIPSSYSIEDLREFCESKLCHGSYKWVIEAASDLLKLFEKLPSFWVSAKFLREMREMKNDFEVEQECFLQYFLSPDDIPCDEKTVYEEVEEMRNRKRAYLALKSEHSEEDTLFQYIDTNWETVLKDPELKLPCKLDIHDRYMFFCELFTGYRKQRVAYAYKSLNFLADKSWVSDSSSQTSSHEEKCLLLS